MDIEPAVQSGIKKKFLITTLLIVIFATAIFVGNFYYQNISTATPETLNTPPPREPTEAEKLLKFQNEELDKLRAQHQGQNAIQSTTTMAAEIKSIDILRNQALKQKINTTAPRKTMEQQLQELDALRAAAQKQ